MTFTVYGKPVPQGSMKAFYNKRTHRAIVTSDNKNLRPWRQEVTIAAIGAVKREINEAGCYVTTDAPVRVDAVFYFNKPKSAPKRVHHTVKPDGDKLMRGLLDALTGVGYLDDAQVVAGSWEKRYDPVERAEITITPL